MLDKIEQEQTNKLKSMSPGKKGKKLYFPLRRLTLTLDGDVSLSAIRGAQTSGDSMNSTTIFGLETSSTAAPMVASSSGGLSMEQKMREWSKINPLCLKFSRNSKIQI